MEGIFVLVGFLAAVSAAVTGLLGIGAPMRDGYVDSGDNALPLLLFFVFIVCMMTAAAIATNPR